MAEFTVGPVGGDYADWGAAWLHAVSLSPFADDHYFRQIETCTINNDFPATRVDLNGHALHFYVPEAAQSGGNPNAGLITNLVGASGDLHMRFDNAVQSHNLYLDGLNIKQTDNTNIGGIVFIGPWNSAETMTANVRNCIIEGWDNTVSFGIRFMTDEMYINVNNLKIFKCLVAFEGTFSALSAGVPMFQNHIVENVTVYDFGTFGFKYVNSPGMATGAGWTFRNCVAVGGNGNPAVTPTGWLNIGVGAGAGLVELENCADTDDSISTFVNQVNKTDINAPVVAADEFESLNDANARFLFLKEGVVTADFTREPAGNVEVNQKIKFTPSVILTPGAASLYNTGRAPTIQANDIAGLLIPDYNDDYPIGCHVQEYAP